VVSESEKAKAKRQLQCQNDEKMTCCYICFSRRDCAISCKFLGNFGSSVPQVESQIDIQNKLDSEQETDASLIENTPAVCSSCNVEVSQFKTKLKVEGWSGLHPKPSGGSSGEEFLPVKAYLCPKCGKIEFKVDNE
jgi:hypothetical protein